MTKDMVMDKSTATSDAEGNAHVGISAARETIRAATVQVGEAVDTVRTSLPEMAKASRDLASDALQRIEAGSDQQISAGATMSLGLAIGMLLGGAPRILIALALVPVAAIGIVMLGRRPARPMGSSASTAR
jgi:hypothetical protein